LAGFPVASAGAPPAPGALGKSDASALLARLKQSAPAQNPKTPDSRIDPGIERLQSANQVRVSLEKLSNTINDDEAILKALVTGMHSVVTKILAEVDPQEILASAASQLGKAQASASPVPQAGPTAGMPGMPGAGAGAMPPPPGPGMAPGMPSGPVSPGTPG
jgi:UDP:flavonoid glycosyltransferase YjiC (YdhE family)